jgi:Ca-activated chloride channel family protein
MLSTTIFGWFPMPTTLPLSDDTLRLNSTLSHPAILAGAGAGGQPRLVHLLLEVSGGSQGESLPMNLGLVVDVSESMHIRLVSDVQFRELASQGLAQEIITDGVPAWQINSAPPDLVNQLPRRIDYLRTALVKMADYLSAADRFSLVAFAGRSQVILPTIGGTERNRLLQTASSLEYLSLGDGTQMDEGLRLGLEELQRLPEADDGKARASRLILLTDGHTRGVEQCYALAQKAHQLGLPISTLGLGTEFNEDLLIPLADLTGGRAYYIEKPEQIEPAFDKELGAARAVRFRNVEIKLRFPVGVELRQAHRVLPELGLFDPGPNQAGSYALLLGNYDPSAPPTLLIELLLPAWQSGSYRLAQALLAWDDPQGGLARASLRQDVVIQVNSNAQSNQAASQRVMNIIEKVSAFRLGTQALEEATRGDRQAATLRLRQAATRLLDMGESILAGAMLRQAEALERGGTLDPNITKKLRYETRRLTRQLED